MIFEYNRKLLTWFLYVKWNRFFPENNQSIYHQKYFFSLNQASFGDGKFPGGQNKQQLNALPQYFESVHKVEKMVKIMLLVRSMMLSMIICDNKKNPFWFILVTNSYTAIEFNYDFGCMIFTCYSYRCCCGSIIVTAIEGKYMSPVGQHGDTVRGVAIIGWLVKSYIFHMIGNLWWYES